MGVVGDRSILLARAARSPNGGRAPAVLASLLLGLLTACTQPEATPTLPDGPDLRPLAARYDAPTGTVTAADLDALLAQFAATRARLEELGLIDELEGPLREVLDDLAAKAGELGFDGFAAAPASAAAPTAPTRRVASTEVDLYARVTRVCPGLRSPPVAEAGNGKLVLHAGVVGTDALAPNVFVDVLDCVYTAAGRATVLRGGARAATVFLGDGLRFSELATLPLLFSVQLSVQSGDAAPEPLVLDFRVSGDGTLELRLPVSGGDAIVGVRVSGELFVRDARGTATCTQEPRCTDASGKVWP
jgi:hypothetical protein